MASPKTVRFIDGEEEFVDFAITCQHVEFRVHKVMLGRGSGFFKAALKRRNFKEAIEGRMDLPDDDDPALVEAMLHYLYKGTYQTSEEKVPVEDALHRYTKLYSLADRMDIPGMRDAARKDFVEQLEGPYDHDSFAAIIAEVYSSTPENDRGLRDPVVKRVMDDFGTFIARPSFLTMMETNGCFGRDLVTVLNSFRSGILGRFSCPVCYRRFERVMKLEAIQDEYCPHCSHGNSAGGWYSHLII